MNTEEMFQTPPSRTSELNLQYTAQLAAQYAQQLAADHPDQAPTHHNGQTNPQINRALARDFARPGARRWRVPTNVIGNANGTGGSYSNTHRYHLFPPMRAAQPHIVTPEGTPVPQPQ